VLPLLAQQVGQRREARGGERGRRQAALHAVQPAPQAAQLVPRVCIHNIISLPMAQTFLIHTHHSRFIPVRARSHLSDQSFYPETGRRACVLTLYPISLFCRRVDGSTRRQFTFVFRTRWTATRWTVTRCSFIVVVFETNETKKKQKSKTILSASFETDFQQRHLKH
jgi:hypothetical protein